ncbi:MAG: ATP-binding protein [Burkholderiaceae bacterium]
MIGKFRHSVSVKLMLVVLTTTLIALLAASAAMLAYEYKRFQTVRTNDLFTQAEILAMVSVPALEFNDRRAATENLEQLRLRKNVLAAAIYLPDGRLYARYLAKGNEAFKFPVLPSDLEPRFDGDKVAVVHKIVRNGELVGLVYIFAQFGIYERLTDLALILAIAMSGSFILAALLALRMQKGLTRPIISITRAVQQVIDSRNFSMRVPKSSEDEIGILVESFNKMLNEIGERTRALEASNSALTKEMDIRVRAEEGLQQANETLEARIAKRTAELEYAHEQLRQAQKMEAIGQLTGGIAHDFNNLLAGMVGNMEMLRIRLEQGRTEEFARYIDSAMLSMDRAAALTHRLLAFSRRQTLAPKQTNVTQLVESMEDMLRRTIGPGIELQAALQAGIWNTLCDPNQLESALLNLAINARDAMPDGGTLKIITRNGVPDGAPFAGTSDAASREFVTISISDNGTGMPQDVLARACDPFYTTKPIGQGTGLGLSMVYGFVTQSGGHINLSSEVGVGTTVYIHLPRMQEAAAADDTSPDETTAPHAAKHSTILMVDDEEAIRGVVKEKLEELGYQVLEAGDALQAMKFVNSEHAIDLLLSDVGLPNGMNGRQLADAAREVRPELKVLFMTGYAHSAAFEDGSLGQSMDVMIKPFKLDALGLKVSRMLDDVLSD